MAITIGVGSKAVKYNHFESCSRCHTHPCVCPKSAADLFEIFEDQDKFNQAFNEAIKEAYERGFRDARILALQIANKYAQ